MTKKTLPERFEEFSDARRKGFIDVMNIKARGGLIAGVFCAYTPVEVLEAAGMVTVGLCGTSQETIPAAETVLPKNLCPLIKSSYGFALTEKCPYFYFADILIGETTCDGKKKMYELLSDMGKNVYSMHLPQGNDREYEVEFWAKEIRRLIEHLEDTFDVKITDKKLRSAIILLNGQRRLRQKMFELQKLSPPPMWGTDMILTAEGDSFKFNKDKRHDSLADLIDQIESEYMQGKRPVPVDAKRIMITGCPMGGVVEKIGKTTEKNGGVIVCYDTCAGTRTIGIQVDESEKDLVHALAERYLKIGCSVLTPNNSRLDNISNLISEYRVDGVIEVILQACHTFNIEAVRVKNIVQSEGIPYICIETDYSESDIGQISTRLQAFLEMI